jgi:membrane-associated phospholipid phosphatase
MKKAAWAVSVVFHPLLLTTYLFIVVSLAMPSLFQPLSTTFRNWFLLLVFVLTVVIPSLNIWMFRKSGTISNITLSERRERIIPFLWILGVYGLTAYLFYSRLSLNGYVMALLAVSTCLVAVALLLTFFLKVSVHTLGMGGAMATLVVINTSHEEALLVWPIGATIAVTGLVTAARLYLNAHSPLEVYTGLVAGIFTGGVGMILMF